MELRGRGWSIAAAAREVGVSRTAANNWARGYKVYRKGQIVGAVAPLDRLATREISSRYLSQNERIEIADLRHAGLTISEIATQIGRAASTVSRELARNGRKGGYQPFEAHRKATARRARDHKRRVDTKPELSEIVGELLAQRWSPQQIARHLRARHPEDRSMWLCHESIYQAIYQPGSRLVRPPKVAAPHRSPLRTGRDHRRAQQRPQRRRPRFEQPMLSIHQRPFEPEDRSQAGHWEGDLIIGKNARSAIGTLVERQTRTIRLLHMPERDADALHAAIIARMADLPPALIRSITWDQGTEMARHTTITTDMGAPIYFCDSHSPWQRGSNENANGLLRQYFPKATDLGVHSPEHLRAVEEEINKRPRLILDDRPPADLLAELLTQTTSDVATLAGTRRVTSAQFSTVIDRGARADQMAGLSSSNAAASMPRSGEKLFEVPVGQPVPQVPAHRQQDHLGWEPESIEAREDPHRRCRTASASSSHPHRHRAIRQRNIPRRTADVAPPTDSAAMAAPCPAVSLVLP